MEPMLTITTRLITGVLGALLPISVSIAQQADVTIVRIGVLSQALEQYIPMTSLEPIYDDLGLQGARLASDDNNTTGRFVKQEFRLTEVVVPSDEAPEAAFKKLVSDGHRLILLDLPADMLLAVADQPAAADTLLFNIRARDDSLRNADCRANVLHAIPSRAMLADALAQYLSWKRWREVFLVVGKHPEDKAYAAAVRRAAKRFGLTIVAEKQWIFDPGARRTDSGHVNAQQEIPSFTRGVDYEVLVVADERDEFGEHLNFRTHLPRPVAGTQGLTPLAWHRTSELYGATQFQRRFHKRAGRWMTSRDYAAWIAVRSIGEAATRTASNDVARIAEYIRSSEFALAVFKGVPVSYRDWNGQLRQPVLITGSRIVVTMSPQRGFLHQFTTLDTLGYDRPESECTFAR